MKMTRLVMAIILGVPVLAACSGDGSSSGDTAPALPTQAVLKISTEGTLGPATMIGGIEVTATLPPGVRVNATPDAQNPSVLVTDDGVVLSSGVTGTNAIAFATYDGTDRKVIIDVVDQDGFGAGEFVTVNCIIDAGSPQASEFGVQGLEPKDLNGASISGLTAGYIVDIR